MLYVIVYISQITQHKSVKQGWEDVFNKVLKNVGGVGVDSEQPYCSLFIAVSYF